MRKRRITITLDKRLLNLLDKQIDREKIRNRSHAIEYLLFKSLLPRPKKALILAGGRGIKLRHFACEIPKALLLIQNLPILQHEIELLKKYDFKEIIVSVGQLGEKIINYFGDGEKFGVKIFYVKQGKSPKGTGGAVKAAKKFLKEEAFLVFYGDVLAEIDVDDFLAFHKRGGKVATLALTTAKETSMWGVVELRGGEILGFFEKPQKSLRSHLINAGIYVFEPEIFDWFPKKEKFSLEKEVFPKLAKERKLAGWVFEGKWFDVGTPEGFKRAQREWKGID